MKLTEKEVDKLADEIIQTEILYRADALVEFLMESEELDAINHMANRWYCPECDCPSSKCHDIDDSHDYEAIKVAAWYLVTPELAGQLESIEEVVLSLSELDVYFWGRRHDKYLLNILSSIMSDGTFQDIARMRLGKENHAK